MIKVAWRYIAYSMMNVFNERNINIATKCPENKEGLKLGNTHNY